jgi:hypothetical protein
MELLNTLHASLALQAQVSCDDTEEFLRL